MTNSENDKLEHIIFDNGTESWESSNGHLHQNEDIPAIIYPNGDEEYCKEGKRFRKFGPKIKHPDGHEVWNTNENYHWHREDGATVILSNGEREYYINGKIVNYDKFRKRQIRTHNI